VGDSIRTGRAKRDPASCPRRIHHFLPALCTLVVLALALGVVADEARASKLTDARSDLRAARAQLGTLQSELDDLAGRYMRAEARLYELDNAVEAAEKDKATSQRDLEQMRVLLSGRLVRLYKDGGGSIPLFLEVLFQGGDFSTVVDRFALLNRVAAQDRDVLEEVDSHLEKVGALEADLAQKRVEQEAEMVELQAARDTMESRMRAVASEYSRLKKRVATLEEEARRAAEAERARANAAVASNRGAAAAAKGFVFPVDGPHSYINDWGFPRSGGRSHKGTDIMAARGTPVVAVVSGRVGRTAYGSGLGGTIIWLDGNNGTSYYYAHLDGIAGGIGSGTSVRAGQVIGYVGSTGNARGGSPHLHFEVHPGGGGAANPYYILRASD
jgi:murein DD-endopeptidase MepM/ murein hydrolase activator NlpD